MKLNKYSEAIATEADLVRALYLGKLHEVFDFNTEDEELVNQFNKAVNKNGDRFPKLKTYKEDPLVDVDFFDEANQTSWFIPEDKVHHNLIEMLYGMCKTPEQTTRVNQELELFIQHGMLDLLFYLKYLVDTMREHKIVWGVGRGSSVASYVLYLIGVHKIDSIKYELDIHEFLKGE
jgi:DNA polymerase III alpha subunit